MHLHPRSSTHAVGSVEGARVHYAIRTPRDRTPFRHSVQRRHHHRHPVLTKMKRRIKSDRERVCVCVWVACVLLSLPSDYVFRGQLLGLFVGVLLGRRPFSGRLRDDDGRCRSGHIRLSSAHCCCCIKSDCACCCCCCAQCNKATVMLLCATSLHTTWRDDLN